MKKDDPAAMCQSLPASVISTEPSAVRSGQNVCRRASSLLVSPGSLPHLNTPTPHCRVFVRAFSLLFEDEDR